MDGDHRRGAEGRAAELVSSMSADSWGTKLQTFQVANRRLLSTLANYGARSRKGLPISSSIAESAVNQVVSHRMAKKQQMRWTDEGAHSWPRSESLISTANSRCRELPLCKDVAGELAAPAGPHDSTSHGLDHSLLRQPASRAAPGARLKVVFPRSLAATSLGKLDRGLDAVNPRRPLGRTWHRGRLDGH